MRRFCRALFSRYAVSAIMIILEVALMSYLFISASDSVYIVIALSLLVSVFAFFNILIKNTNPEYKISWVAIILLMPPFGAMLYFIFYQRRMSKREIRLISGVVSELNSRAVRGDVCPMLKEESPRAAGKAEAILSDDDVADLYRGTESKYFPSGEEYFESLISELEGARRYIFLEYFIIEPGVLWDKIHSVLVKKAGEGVDVRLLYDDVGCMSTLPYRYEYLLRKEGIRAYRFAKVSPRVSSVHHNRDHRKIAVIDGRVAYTGGVNIADEYANIKKRFGYWKDGGICIRGLAVGGLLKLFLSSWDFVSKTISDYDALLSSVEEADNPDGGYYLPFGSGPNPIYRRQVGKNCFLNIINQAERYVYITTPYLIIDYDLTESLRNAALRGVDVRIITPGIADKKAVKIMTKSSYPYLIEAGVKIYEYAPGFIHEKLIVSDGEYAVVGTINFDFRSLVHHFECAVWMHKTDTVDLIKDGFCQTLADSVRVSSDKSRLTFTEWVLRNAVRLFFPLL